MAKLHGLSKTEKLKSRKQIELLFATGKSFTVFPLRASYSLSAAAGTLPVAQIGVTASKRNFKRAVDRNRIKRLLREAYRLQKIELATILQQKNAKAFVFFMYTGKEMPTFVQVKNAMEQCLQKLIVRTQELNEDIS
jgi:ribonuclease P protein component